MSLIKFKSQRIKEFEVYWTNWCIYSKDSMSDFHAILEIILLSFVSYIWDFDYVIKIDTIVLRAANVIIQEIT